LRFNFLRFNLERTQRKGARFVPRDFLSAIKRYKQMLRYLKWERIADRITKAKLIIMYRIVKGEIVIPIETADLQPGRRGRFIQHPRRYQQYKNSFYPRTISDVWNLPHPGSKILPLWTFSRAD